MEIEKVFCSHCGQQIIMNSHYCCNCGFETPFSRTLNSQRPSLNSENPITNPKLNKAATSGLILGILSLFCWLIPLIGAPISIIGLVRSTKGLNADNKGHGIAGLVLNIIGLIATAINFIIGAYIEFESF